LSVFDWNPATTQTKN